MMKMPVNLLSLAIVLLFAGCGKFSRQNFVGSDNISFEKLTGIECPSGVEVLWFQGSRVSGTRDLHLIAKFDAPRTNLNGLASSLLLERVISSGGYVSTQVLNESNLYAKFWNPPDLVAQFSIKDRYQFSGKSEETNERNYNASLVWIDGIAYFSMFGPYGGLDEWSKNTQH